MINVGQVEVQARKLVTLIGLLLASILLGLLVITMLDIGSYGMIHSAKTRLYSVVVTSLTLLSMIAFSLTGRDMKTYKRWAAIALGYGLLVLVLETHRFF